MIPLVAEVAVKGRPEGQVHPDAQRDLATPEQAAEGDRLVESPGALLGVGRNQAQVREFMATTTTQQISPIRAIEDPSLLPTHVIVHGPRPVAKHAVGRRNYGHSNGV